MNKTLLLPTKAIQKIVNHGKAIIIIKDFPPDFSTKKDSLLIYNLDTGEYYGTFRVRFVGRGRLFLLFFFYYLHYIAFIQGSVFNYLKPKSKYIIVELYSYMQNKKEKTT